MPRNDWPYGKKPKFESPEDMKAIVDEYFRKCKGRQVTNEETGEPMFTKWGQPIIVGAHPPTMVGLALALGFSSRQGLQSWKAKKGYREVLMEAVSRIEEYTEQRLFDKDGINGAKFSLMYNFGWRDQKKEEEKQVASVTIINDIPRGDIPVAANVVIRDDDQAIAEGAATPEPQENTEK